MSILEHLEALRRVFIISFVSIIPGAVLGWIIRDKTLALLVAPVKRLNYDLVFITATEALTAHLKISVVAGLIFASPVIAYQFWKFVLPALHTHEKRYLLIFIPSSVILFVGGISFAYYSVFSYAVKFLLSFGGEGLAPMLSLSKYLSFTIWFLLPFGVIFELPLVVVALARLGIVTPRFLASKRKFAVLAGFAIAAVVTPTTDMITQGIMGGAMYLLYEISIWLAYLVRPGRKKQTALPETEALPVEIAGDADDNSHDGGSDSNEADSSDTNDTSDVDNTNGANRVEKIYRDIVERGESRDSEDRK